MKLRTSKTKHCLTCGRRMDGTDDEILFCCEWCADVDRYQGVPPDRGFPYEGGTESWRPPYQGRHNEPGDEFPEVG